MYIWLDLNHFSRAGPAQQLTSRKVSIDKLFSHVFSLPVQVHEELLQSPGHQRSHSCWELLKCLKVFG